MNIPNRIRDERVADKAELITGCQETEELMGKCLPC